MQNRQEMNTMDVSSSGAKRTCTLCGIATGSDSASTLKYGDWMVKGDLRVHYFCLLLSTNLSQNGTDKAGILGFQMRDIRNEIANAAKRNCRYCCQTQASIKCENCGKYFHLVCGTLNHCLFEFIDAFKSYCVDCQTPNEFQRRIKAESSDSRIPKYCYICKNSMALKVYHQTEWVYGPCCSSGFAHKACMQRYALSAGYYLRCIWCKATSFRDAMRYMGVFVPDRDAQWEREERAFAELHKGHRSCDMEECLCPRGRDFFAGKWKLILCECCGSVGAHNPFCVLGTMATRDKLENFKCSTCAAIVIAAPQQDVDDLCDISILMYKHNRSQSDNEKSLESTTRNFFSRSSAETVCSVDTVHKNDQPLEAMELPPNYESFEVVTYRLQDGGEEEEPNGIAVVRIDLNSPRFAGKTLSEIKDNGYELLTPDDIVPGTFSDDLSFIKDIESIIEKIAAKEQEEEKEGLKWRCTFRTK